LSAFHCDNNYGHTGDGIRMAEAAGAVCENYYGLISNEICGANQKHGSAMYDADWNLNNENLCFAIYGGLMVDETGERFMNEDIPGRTSPTSSRACPRAPTP